MGAARIGNRAVLAAVIGNALEWYDFIIYALFASYIAATFFPVHDQTESLLLAVATFGAGFIVRPLGALVLGQYSDRRGRRAAMSLIIALMTLAVALLTFTPSYARIGIAAPVLIVISRLLQGFSVGGELGSSTAMLIENAPVRQRGLYASLQGSSQSVASLAGACAGALAATLMSHDQMMAWGWRLPFAVGLLIGPVGLYIRAGLDEPTSFERRLRPDSVPLVDLWQHHRAGVLRVVGLVCLGTMCTYVLQLNLPVYAQRELNISPGGTFLSAAIASIVSIVFITIFGRISDRYGPRPIMIPGAIAIGLLVYPAFWLLTAVPTLPMLIAVQAVCLMLSAAVIGPSYGLIGILFPPEVRSSGLSVGYNIGVLTFGGFAPFFTAKLIALTHDKHMPGIYVSIGAVITLAALTIGWPANRREPPQDESNIGQDGFILTKNLRS